MTLDAGASIQDVAGNLSAFVLLPGAGGGTVGTVHGYEAVGLPGFVTGSTSTITNAIAFEARAPAGAFTTSTAWGLYLGTGWDQNYIAGKLKIGTTGGDTATQALDVDGKIHSSDDIIQETVAFGQTLTMHGGSQLIGSASVYIAAAGGAVNLRPGFVTKMSLDSTGIGFFGTAPVAQQASSGPQTAGAVYTATEQTMLQQVYDAMRAYGLLS